MICEICNREKDEIMPVVSSHLGGVSFRTCNECAINSAEPLCMIHVVTEGMTSINDLALWARDITFYDNGYQSISKVFDESEKYGAKPIDWSYWEVAENYDNPFDSGYCKTKELPIEGPIPLQPELKCDYYQVVLPSSILSIFYKDIKIEMVKDDNLNIPRSLFYKHRSIIPESEYNDIIANNPEFKKFFNKWALSDTVQFNKQYFMNLFENNPNAIFEIQRSSNKPKYLFLITDVSILETFKFIDCIDSIPPRLFGYIDDHNMTGIEQLISDSVATIISDQIRDITNINVFPIIPNKFSGIFERVDKYVYFNRNYLCKAGNSGGGNLTSYLSEEEFMRRDLLTYKWVRVASSFKLKKEGLINNGTDGNTKTNESN